MLRPFRILKANFPYAYVALGVVWLVFAFVAGSLLLLWATLAFLAGGALLKMRPTLRLTWAWSNAAALMGLVLAAFQAYAAAVLVSGPLSTIAAASLAVFLVFSAVHVLFVYVGNAKSEER